MVLFIYLHVWIPMGVSEAQDVVHVFIVGFKLLRRHDTPSFLAMVLLILLLLEKSCAIRVGRTILSAQKLLVTLGASAVEFPSHLLLQRIGHLLFHSLSVAVDWHGTWFNLLAIIDSLCLIFELRVACWRGSTVSLGSSGAESPSHGTINFMWTRRRPNIRVSGRIDLVPIHNCLAILGLDVGLLFQL